MNAQQLAALISEGETNKIEFKIRLLNQHDIAKVLTAFANTEGGTVIFGVQEDGEVIGLAAEEAIKTERRLERLCSSIFSYPVEIGKSIVSGKYIVYANIGKAPKHFRPLTTSSGEYYIRRNDGNIKIDLGTTVFSSIYEKPKPSKPIVGFVAMSFRDEEEPALIDYYRAMERAVEKTRLPLKLIRLDLQDGDFEISQQIMTEIDKCNFVLADFTLNPHNVYFELGYARGAQKKIIQTSRKDVILQFDVRNWNTLFYRNATELEEKLIPKLESLYVELTV